MSADGLPPFRLVRYQDVLRLCEDSTGLLVGPTDRRLFKLGVYQYNVVGEYYHQRACREGDFSPGTRVRLVREPQNTADPNAVAVRAWDPDVGVAGYVSRGHARRLAKLMDAGLQLAAIATRGTGTGAACEAIAVIAAEPRVLRHLMSPRPSTLPPPLFSVFE